MDKQKLQQDINELKAKLAEMESELNKPEPVINYWQPKDGDDFFYVDIWENVRKGLVNYENTMLCRVFKTKEQAQAYAEYVKAEETLKAEIARLNEGWWPDWKDMNTVKYFIKLKNGKILEEDYFYGVKILPNFMYLKSRESAQHLIKTHSKELKTYLSY